MNSYCKKCDDWHPDNKCIRQNRWVRWLWVGAWILLFVLTIGRVSNKL